MTVCFPSCLHCVTPIHPETRRTAPRSTSDSAAERLRSSYAVWNLFAYVEWRPVISHHTLQLQSKGWEFCSHLSIIDPSTKTAIFLSGPEMVRFRASTKFAASVICYKYEQIAERRDAEYRNRSRCPEGLWLNKITQYVSMTVWHLGWYGKCLTHADWIWGMKTDLRWFSFLLNGQVWASILPEKKSFHLGKKCRHTIWVSNKILDDQPF